MFVKLLVITRLRSLVRSSSTTVAHARVVAVAGGEPALPVQVMTR